MPESLSGHRGPPSGGKQSVRYPAVENVQAGEFQIFIELVAGHVAQGYQALLVAFANYAHHTHHQIHLRPGQSDQFGHSQASGIQDFEHRGVAPSQRRIAAGRRQQGINVDFAQCRREIAAGSRPFQAKTGVVFAEPLADQPGEKSPETRQTSGCCSGRSGGRLRKKVQQFGFARLF